MLDFQADRRAPVKCDRFSLVSDAWGMAPVDACRRHGISPATFCKWKSKFGGSEMPVARRLRSLEEEDSQLKKLPAQGYAGLRGGGGSGIKKR